MMWMVTGRLVMAIRVETRRVLFSRKKADLRRDKRHPIGKRLGVLFIEAAEVRDYRSHEAFEAGALSDLGDAGLLVPVNREA